jgi:hypothetical protein
MAAYTDHIVAFDIIISDISSPIDKSFIGNARSDPSKFEQ